MNDSQSHLLTLLKEIDAICQDNNLKYYLAGGSLVGGMRNKGFLPWDDDADIHMPRADAMRLLELSHTGKLPENRTIVSYHDYDDPPLLHWRYIDTSSTVILRSTYITNIPQGQFVDIFVLNPAPAGEEAQRKFEEDSALYWDLFANHIITLMRSDEHLRRYRYWTRLRKMGFEKFMHRHFRKRLFELPDDSSDEYAVLSPLAPKLFIKKDIFGTPRRIPFEDTTLCVAEQAEEMLAQVYGNTWVELPQLRERESHIMICDFVFPYDVVLRDFDSLTDRAEDARESWQWKHDYMFNIHLRNDVNPKTHTIRHELLAADLNLAWRTPDEETGVAPCEAIADQVRHHEYDNSRVFFSRYFNVQLGENAAYWRLFVPICDEALWCAWYPRFMEGAFAATLKILARRESYSSEPLSPDVDRLKNLCLEADELTYQLWTRHDPDAVKAILEEHAGDADPSVVFLRGQLALELMLESQSARFDECLAYAERAMETYPLDGELAYWRAVALDGMGRSAEARTWYQFAEQHLVNGLLLTQTQEILRQSQTEVHNHD